MAPDTPMPVDEKPVAAGSPKKRYLLCYFSHTFLSFIFLILLVVFVPRWFPPLGDWLFPYVKKTQIEQWHSQWSSLSTDVKSQGIEKFNERLHFLEEKLQKTQNALETSLENKKSQEQPSEKPSCSSLSAENAYFMEALLLCQEIEGRLLAEQDYQTPLALLAALLKTPEEKAWLSVLTNTIPTPKESTETLTTHWPSWLKPLENFFTVQPLTNKVSLELSDRRMALQKLKDVLIIDRQKASLAVTSQEAKS